MKFALAAATLGAVSSCPIRDFYMRHYACGINSSQNMEFHTFTRKAVRTVLNSAVKGFYHDPRADLLDEKCMGPWVDTKLEQSKDTLGKIWHGDIWGVSHNDLKALTGNFWDILLDNIDDCSIYRMIYNKYEWCMNDIETCVYHKDIGERIIDNGVHLAMNGWEIYKIFSYYDKCETDEFLLGRIGNATEKIAENISTLKGFEGKWDKNSEYEKLTIREMWHNVVDKKHHTPRPHFECPVKEVFEHFFPNIAPRIEKAVHMVGVEIESIFHPHHPHHAPKQVHHHKKDHHHGHH
jgi:hypothetical protein